MSSWLPGALGVATLFVLLLGFFGWLGSRRLLSGSKPARPLAAAADGWRTVWRLLRSHPKVALLAYLVKTAQIYANSARELLMVGSPAGRVWSSIAIDFGFTLAWSVVAIQIALFALAPELPRDEARRRTLRALRYALAFWAVPFGLTLVGIVWIALLHSRSRILVTQLVLFMPYIFIIASALTRPAIAVDLPGPFKECRRIVRENWFGIAITLALAALPLGLLYLTVGLARDYLHVRVHLALALEAPIGLVSMFCYAAYEGAIAQMYRRIA